MQVLDPGHEYLLDSLDGAQENRLVFVKREGEKYPGNVGSHPGTTMQEVLRALIDRAKYVNNQIPCVETKSVIAYMEHIIWLLEMRASHNHGIWEHFSNQEAAYGQTCKQCGHIKCNHKE
jgi:hypothetical protein